MWTCPQCERNFKNLNQSHFCVQIDIDDLFDNKPQQLLLAFDKLLINVIDWQHCGAGATPNTIVFSKGKAWMIARPMTKWLDITAISTQAFQHKMIRKVTQYGKSFRHHIRVTSDDEINQQLIDLLRKIFDSVKM